MSISFQSKINETLKTYDEIQSQKEMNFRTECIKETERFYYDYSKKEYKNIPFIQFSFLDFGQGIVETLRDQYIKHFPEKTTALNESEILRYAFDYDSSRHPIIDNESKNELKNYIPRGLFDVLTIARRYNGLLIVRSVLTN